MKHSQTPLSIFSFCLGKEKRISGSGAYQWAELAFSYNRTSKVGKKSKNPSYDFSVFHPSISWLLEEHYNVQTPIDSDYGRL